MLTRCKNGTFGRWLCSMYASTDVTLVRTADVNGKLNAFNAIDVIRDITMVMVMMMSLCLTVRYDS